MIIWLYLHLQSSSSKVATISITPLLTLETSEWSERDPNIFLIGEDAGRPAKHNKTGYSDIHTYEEEENDQTWPSHKWLCGASISMPSSSMSSSSSSLATAFPFLCLDLRLFDRLTTTSRGLSLPFVAAAFRSRVRAIGERALNDIYINEYSYEMIYITYEGWAELQKESASCVAFAR